jgi:rhodanese-related sulfurtransferase
MKKLVLLAVVLFHFLLIHSQERDSLAYISLRPAEFSEEMNIVSNPVLLDVREPFEFRRSRIKNAINISSKADLQNFTDSLIKTAHIFLYCSTDYRSIRAAEDLIQKGFLHVYNLDGGIVAWRKAGFPVERRKKMSVER